MPIISVYKDKDFFTKDEKQSIKNGPNDKLEPF